MLFIGGTACPKNSPSPVRDDRTFTNRRSIPFKNQSVCRPFRDYSWPRVRSPTDKIGGLLSTVPGGTFRFFSRTKIVHGVAQRGDRFNVGCRDSPTGVDPDFPSVSLARPKIRRRKAQSRRRHIYLSHYSRQQDACHSQFGRFLSRIEKLVFTDR